MVSRWSPTKPGFEPRATHVESVVEKVQWGRFSSSTSTYSASFRWRFILTIMHIPSYLSLFSTQHTTRNFLHIHCTTRHHIGQLSSQSRLGRTRNVTTPLLCLLTTLPESETTNCKFAGLLMWQIVIVAKPWYKPGIWVGKEKITKIHSQGSRHKKTYIQNRHRHKSRALPICQQVRLLTYTVYYSYFVEFSRPYSCFLKLNLTRVST
jgi:hypothetical protein